MDINIKKYIKEKTIKYYGDMPSGEIKNDKLLSFYIKEYENIESHIFDKSKFNIVIDKQVKISNISNYEVHNNIFNVVEKKINILNNYESLYKNILSYFKKYNINIIILDYPYIETANEFFKNFFNFYKYFKELNVKFINHTPTLKDVKNGKIIYTLYMFDKQPIDINFYRLIKSNIANVSSIYLSSIDPYENYVLDIKQIINFHNCIKIEIIEDHNYERKQKLDKINDK